MNHFRTKTKLAALMCCLVLGAAVARAQTPSNLVITVGTTIQDSSGNNWSYVLLGSPQPQVLQGKQFAIYSKPNYPTNSGTYTFRGNIFQQTDPTAISTLLNQSLALGENLSTLRETLDTLLHSVPGITNESIASKVVTAFQVAATNASTAQLLGLVTHVNPGLTLCAGQAFSEEITGVTTYEVREINLGTSVAGEVVGQVTVIPGSPIVMPAPGYPFQVVTNAPSDNLRIRLRWGTTPAYRRLALLGYGFDVWRIALSNAISLGVNSNTPPTLQQLYSNADFTMANQSPVMATKDFTTGTGAGAADDPGDGTTYFFADDDQALTGNPIFNDGDQFYYFITARDVLGRDGLVSPGGLGQACRRIPPAAPTNIVVQNVYHVLPGSNQQALMISWAQDLSVTDMVNQYWIYRWPDPTMALTNEALPSNGLVGIVNQFPGSPTNSYTDNGNNAPLVPGLTNYWYTVKSVSITACGPLLSPNSMPAWGVLRERFGPNGTTGQVIGSCGTPAVIFDEADYNSNNIATPDYVNWNYSFTCTRDDPGIAWVEFEVTNQDGLGQILGPIYFPPSGDSVTVNYSTPITGAEYVAQVSCIAGTLYGLDSLPATDIITSAPPSTATQDLVFETGQVMLTSLNVNDPLLSAVTSVGNCFTATSATAYPDGTVRLTFGRGKEDLGPLLIEVPSGVVIAYVPPTIVGVAYPGPDGTYTVYYPDCLLGPLPEFLGCPISIPDDGTCTQAVSSGAPNGPINPIQITFVLQPRTYEYRLYRTVNNGPKTMIAQDAATYNPADPYKNILVTDDTMPPSVSRLCYYVQLLDEHGNGGPMTLLGCKDVKPATLPRPVLAEPISVGDLSNPQVQLNWFCPTSGVYRFQVMIQRNDHPGGSVSNEFTSTQLSPLVSYNPSSTFIGLLGDAPFAQVRFDGALVSPPSAAFGPGPQFTLTANVLTNVPYNIAVAAMDDEGNAGEPSQVWTFTWKPPVVLPTVPWPSRPLPPVNAFDDIPAPGVNAAYQPRVEAVLLPSQTYPVGVRIGDISKIFTLTANTTGTNFLSWQVQQPIGIAFLPPSPELNPNNYIFKRFSQNPGRNGNPLLPICLYRQQVTNGIYTRVSGALVQVSPLLEQIAYGDSAPFNGEVTVTVYDRLIAGGGEGQYRGQFLYLRDQQPMLQGAAYQYFVARFNDQHEIAELIPAGTVTIPVYLP